MIGHLQGKLIHKEPPSLLVDVGGVGYELEAPMTTFYDLPVTGELVKLYTHLVVREDAQLLYGFSKEPQRRLFRELIKISGIGPRVALAILSGMSGAEFSECIVNGDVSRLTQIPGIGRKTSERLIVEMRDKMTEGAIADIELAASSPAKSDPIGESVSALISLGYKPQEASRLVRGVATEGLATEDIIRQALKRMAG